MKWRQINLILRLTIDKIQKYLSKQQTGFADEWRMKYYESAL